MRRLMPVAQGPQRWNCFGRPDFLLHKTEQPDQSRRAGSDGSIFSSLLICQLAAERDYLPAISFEHAG